jgi:hypothetical protein
VTRQAAAKAGIAAGVIAKPVVQAIRAVMHRMRWTERA